MFLRTISLSILCLPFLCACTGPTATTEINRQTAPSLASDNAAPPADPAVIYANANREGSIGYIEGYFGAGDTKLHYVEAGSGPLIILYHGFPTFWYSWFDQMEALKVDYRVVAVDGLGAGLSAQPQHVTPYKIDKLAKQLDDFSKHLGGDEKYTLIGHDWGSVLALSYAQAYPHRLHKVVGMTVPPLNMFLDHVTEDKEQQQRSQYMQRFRTVTLDMLKATNAAQTAGVSSYKKLADRGDLKSGEVELFKNALASNETLSAAMNWYRANVPAFDAITDADKWPAADAKLMIPTLFIWAEEDRVVVPELIEKMKTAGPEVTVVRLPGINHWTSMEQPELATQAVIDFLAE